MNEFKNMKKNAILTIGVSGSGKSYWAAKFISENPGWIEINRDDLRKEVHFTEAAHWRDQVAFSWDGWKKIKNGEKQVTILQRALITGAAKNEEVKGIIISDTNINPKFRKELVEFMVGLGFEVFYEHFDVAFELAVERDIKRANPVGAFVIAKQMDQLHSQFVEKVVQNSDLPSAIIVDIDGTLAHSNGKRGIYDSTKVHLDDPDEAVVQIIQEFNDTGCFNIIVLSGRDEGCKEATRAWLNEHLGFNPHALYMRALGDRRPDVVVKKELFDNHIRDRYFVHFVIDDRPKVVRMWQKLGLKTLAVGNQWIDF